MEWRAGTTDLNNTRALTYSNEPRITLLARATFSMTAKYCALRDSSGWGLFLPYGSAGCLRSRRKSHRTVRLRSDHDDTDDEVADFWSRRERGQN